MKSIPPKKHDWYFQGIFTPDGEIHGCITLVLSLLFGPNNTQAPLGSRI